jgi:hypothetical protein
MVYFVVTFAFDFPGRESPADRVRDEVPFATAVAADTDTSDIACLLQGESVALNGDCRQPEIGGDLVVSDGMACVDKPVWLALWLVLMVNEPQENPKRRADFLTVFRG